MFEITLLNTVLFALLFLLTYYLIISFLTKRVIRFKYKKLFFYITLFSLFGVTGEVLVNTIYEIIFQVPLWEYRLYPAHDNSISYFFIFVWGSLGFYKYINDTQLSRYKFYNAIPPGLMMGFEAVFLELLYNGLYYLLFGDYIFYYLPENLGVFSHLSCLQVIPFYFMVGYIVSRLLTQQKKIGYNLSIIGFYWMIIVAFVFF